MATSESGGRLDGGLTTATYERMIRLSWWRHDVEWTTIGVSGYPLNTSSTTSAGFAEAGRPTRSDSAWSGFIQKRSVTEPDRKHFERLRDEGRGPWQRGDRPANLLGQFGHPRGAARLVNSPRHLTVRSGLHFRHCPRSRRPRP